MRVPTLLRRLVRPLRPQTERFFVADATPVELPASSTIRRTPRRPLEYRDVGFDENYDDTHLFYDVFWDGSRIVLVGPDLHDLERLVTGGVFRVDGTVVRTVERM
ncbi:MAG TPA: hypothetical protein VHZ56_02980, partial [Devosia sp.]|nr:hypothetical protein [Devosia sp.]